jgi:hypothetical protein
MSEALRIALVAEGPTDRVVIEAALQAMLPNRSFVLKQLHPEGSLAFGALGAGWVGVYRWCKQSARRGNGRIRGDQLVFGNYDLLMLHLDADVASEEYAHGSIVPQPADGDLPCEQACPPAAATTNALRRVLLSWCGEPTEPAQTVVCMPSKSMEAWIVAALFPCDLAMQQTIECYRDPESRLGQQPKSKRIRKKQRDYQDHFEDLKEAWPRLASEEGLGAALRFKREFLAKADPSGNSLDPL